MLAGLVGDPITKSYPDASDRINLEGMKGLVDQLAGRGLDRVIFVSTCSNYGLIPEGQVADETFEVHPLSRYATAKVALEEHILECAPRVDYRPVILRFATAFGLSPRMRFDLTVSEFCRELYLGRELVVYDAATWRPYCHIRDFAEVMRRVLEAPPELVSGEVFNAGGDANNATKAMIVDEVRKLLPEGRVTFQEHGSDPRNYRVSFAKVRERLGFEPSVSIADGVAELLGALRQGVFDEVDANRNFYGNYEIEYPR
jgi:nucleoside-diphosphate-sugar epimerase